MIEVNHSKIKETNRKNIIRLLLEKEEVTKLDISRELDISITTVSTNITQLKKLGIVEEVGSLESTGGRKAIAVRLNGNCKYSLGIAITPNHIKILLINLKNEKIDNIRIRHNNSNIEKIIEIVNTAIGDILNKNNIQLTQLLGIGISIPGTVDSKNGVIKKCYLLKAEDVNIKMKFSYLNVPIYVDNEANFSAYYEYLLKKDAIENLIYISITDGIGLGIIINGSIYRGSNNSSGEMGHMKISMGGKKCNCGARGCLEAYTSKNVLIEKYNEESDKKINHIKEFVKLYENADKTAVNIVKNYISILGLGISNIIMILDSDNVVIGGEINKLINGEIEQLRDVIYKDNLFANKNNCTVEVTKAEEAYLLGAAQIAIEEYLMIK